MKCRAIRQIKDTKGKVVGYALQDDFGTCTKLSSEDIKFNISIGTLYVYNLVVTSDNRLVHQEKYDKLGMSVPSEEFFSGKTRDWILSAANDGLSFIGQQISTGNKYNFRYVITNDKSTYMIVAHAPEVGSLGYESVSRVSRETVDNNLLDKALNKLIKDTPQSRVDYFDN